MAFHPSSVKEQETLNCAYQLHDHTLATADKVKHLHRVSFQKETIWEVHSNKTCPKANKTLRSLRCNFKISATSTEKTAYKAFARPNLEYATPAWGPPPPPPHTHTQKNRQHSGDTETGSRFCAQPLPNHFTRPPHVRANEISFFLFQTEERKYP